jgi:hypothetical protein
MMTAASPATAEQAAMQYAQEKQGSRRMDVVLYAAISTVQAMH